MGKSVLSRKTFLVVFFIFITVRIFAQAGINELLDGYVSASVSGEGTIPYATKINQLFKTYSKDQQTALRTRIYDMVMGDSIVAQKNYAGDFALIDLYSMLTHSGDRKLDDLSFRKGEICALSTGDTIMLKECITALNLSDYSKTTQVTEYISILQDYLEEIRNYLPVSQRIKGAWISDMEDRTTDSSYPLYILVSSEEGIKLEVAGYGSRLISITSGIIKNEENLFPKIVTDLSDEKVYMAWSNEKLQVPNQEVGNILASSTGSAMGILTRAGIQSSIKGVGGEIFGDVMGNIAGGIGSAFVSAMFTPTKTTHVLEMELQWVNKYELVGIAHRQEIEQIGDSKPTIKDFYDNVCFTRYDSNLGIFIEGLTSPENAINYERVTKPYFENGILERGNSLKKAFRYIKKISIIGALEHRKLMYYNEQKMLQEGCKISEKHQSGKIPYLGIDVFEIRANTSDKGGVNEKMKKKLSKLSTHTTGLYITSVDPMSPASLWDIKEGDIICEIDGYPMETEEQYNNYLNSLRPYDWVDLRIKRGKEVLDMRIELTYMESIDW